MTGPRCRSAIIVATTIALTSSVSGLAIAQAQDTTRTIAKNESIFIDGKALTVAQGTSKDDVASQIAKLNAREIGPGAIIFRANDKLYIVDAASAPVSALNDPNVDRQRSYGGLQDRQQSYGGLQDRQQSYGGLQDRQQSYGGLQDRQQSYGGLSDADVDRLRAMLSDPALDRLRTSLAETAIQRQRSYGGLVDRQQSYGGLQDRQQSYGGLQDRQQSYGGLQDRQQSYGGLQDRQQSYGGLGDPDYANYKLKKTFDEVWGATSQKK